MNINLSIEYEEFEANGETCANCKKEIYGKMWVAMMQVGGPEEATPVFNLCDECYNRDTTGTDDNKQ